MSCPFRLNELGKKDRYLASIRYHLKIHAGNKGYRYASAFLTETIYRILCP